MENHINNEKVIDFINEIYVNNNISSEFDELREYAEENKVPIIHREVGEFLKTILVMNPPKHILEIGTAIGFSSIFFAKNTPENTQITTLELNEEVIPLAKENIAKFGYENRINVIQGNALDIIPHLENKYDFIFIDAAKGQYLNFFEEIEPKLTESAIIVSDNILFKGMVADDQLLVRRKKTIVQRLRKYLNLLTTKDGYTSSILPLGDGVCLTIKEERWKKLNY